jgi:hypothetical protein
VVNPLLTCSCVTYFNICGSGSCSVVVGRSRGCVVLFLSVDVIESFHSSGCFLFLLFSCIVLVYCIVFIVYNITSLKVLKFLSS